MAKEKNEPVITAYLKKAADLDGSKEEPAIGARNLILEELQGEARQLISSGTGDVRKTLQKMDEIAEYRRRSGRGAIRLDSDADFQNLLCWRGSLEDFAAESRVRRACDAAVELTKGAISNYRDSRGLNRARNGDLKGAIPDFQAFVDDPKTGASERALRVKWIKSLEQGINPFTQEEIKRLMRD